MLLDFCFASSIGSLEPRIIQCETTLFSPYASSPLVQHRPKGLHLGEGGRAVRWKYFNCNTLRLKLPEERRAQTGCGSGVSRTSEGDTIVYPIGCGTFQQWMNRGVRLFNHCCILVG